MATIKIEFYSDDDDEQGEYIANVEVSGDGDLDHFRIAARAFLAAVGFVPETIEKSLDEVVPRNNLDFDSSQNDE